MNRIRQFAFLLISVSLILILAGAPLAAEDGEKNPPALVTFSDGTTQLIRLTRVRNGVVTGTVDGKKWSRPLSEIRSLSFDVEKHGVRQAHRPIRIALLDLEIDSKGDAQKRLDRIGAQYDVVEPGASLATFERYDVLYFSGNWASLGGLAGIKPKLDEYLRGGGSALFMEPNVNGDLKQSPALGLLPHPITVSNRGATGGVSVKTYDTEEPHPLMMGVNQDDLPYPSDYFSKVDNSWRVLAQSNDSYASPTLLVADVGEGKVILCTARDNDSHLHFFSDRFIVKCIKWLANRPTAELQLHDKHLGERKHPEFVERLQKDYDQLIAKEPAEIRQALVEAERLLRVDAQDSSTWTAYSDAMRILRRTRSKATIPMLLILYADDDLRHTNYSSEIVRTLEILTGHRVPGKNAKEISEKWWFVKRDELQVNLENMDASQRKVVLDHLFYFVGSSESYLEGTSDPKSMVYQLYHLIEYGVDLHYWSVEDVDDALIPDVLAACEQPGKRFHAMVVLSELYKAERFKSLPALASDKKEKPSQRIVACIALWLAKQSVAEDELISLVVKAPSQDLKVAAIITLGNSQTPASIETVVGYLKDKDTNIRQAAVWATRRQQSSEAIAVIGQLLKKNCRSSEPGIEWMISTVSDVQTAQGNKILAELIELTLKESPDDDVLEDLVTAFEYTAEQSFFEDRSESGKEQNIKAAKRALQWWTRP